jgi:hypothetical protein
MGANQHYVPRFYLKNFMNVHKKVWIFDKSTQCVFSNSPKYIASEDFFYDLPEIDEPLGESQAVENYLGKLENKQAPFIKKLINSIDKREIDEIDNNTRLQLCNFLVIQVLRTKEHRELIGQSFNGFKDSILNSGWIPETHKSAFSSLFSERDVKKNHLN